MQSVLAQETVGDGSNDVRDVVHAISHDLGAGTRQLMAYAQLLAEHLGTDLDDESSQLLAHITGSAARFDSRISALHRFATAATDPLQPIRVSSAQVVRDAMAKNAAAAEELDARYVVGPLPTVLADRDILLTVFDELIQNALKFSENGATISIWSASTVGHDVIVVRDDGPGFRDRDAAVAFRLFKRFHHGSIPGTGTGLAVVKRLIERHNGRIGIDKTPDRGAQIRIALPTVDFGPRFVTSSRLMA